jgi:membrane-bound metal-dependent hydrolase YbcI (DUF457 family)
VRPIEHFIVALLPVLVGVLAVKRRLPSLQLIGVVFVGSQFPDLIDKPLALELGLIPTGRVFMHSLPTAIAVLLVVAWYGCRTKRTHLSSGFIFAHLSHILADNYRVLTGPEPAIPPDMLWPLTQATPRPALPYWAGANSINIHLWTLFAVTVLGVCLYVLIADIQSQLRLKSSRA